MALVPFLAQPATSKFVFDIPRAVRLGSILWLRSRPASRDLLLHVKAWGKPPATLKRSTIVSEQMKRPPQLERGLRS